MLKYKHQSMKEQLSSKQKRAQEIIKTNSAISVRGVRFMYTAKKSVALKPVIIVSISKKIIAKATQRNLVRRQLKGLLTDIAYREHLAKYDWMIICKERAITSELRKLITDSLLEKLT
jgi:ribonuclease P protein component